MASWTTIADTSLAQDKPIKAVDVRALRDNPVAIAEGATDAPKIADKFLVGAAAGAPGEVIFSGLDDFLGIRVDGDVFRSGGGTGLELEVSDDGVTYYGTVTLVSGVPASVLANFRLFLDFATGDYLGVNAGGASFSAATFSGTLSGASAAITHVKLTATSSGQISAFAQPQGGASAS